MARCSQSSPRIADDETDCQTLHFCGVVLLPAEVEGRTAVETLLVTRGATGCALAPEAPEAFPQHKLETNALAAAVSFAQSLTIRVGAAYALYRQASTFELCSLRAIHQPHVVAALCAAVTDDICAHGFAAVSPEVAWQLKQAASRCLAHGGSGGMALGSHPWSNAELASRIRALGDMAPDGCSATDVLSVCKLHVKVLCLATLSTLIAPEDHVMQFDQLSLANVLHSRGVLAAVCDLYRHGSTAPAVVRLVMSGVGETVASLFLERMSIFARRSMTHGTAIIGKLLGVALTNGNTPPRHRTRGHAAILLSFAVVNSDQAKRLAVRDAALVWLLSVAAADDTYTDVVCGRAIAAVGNLARAARHSSELEPVIVHLLHVIRKHVLHAGDPGSLIPDDVISSPVHNAVFALGQLGGIVEARALLQAGQAQQLISQLLAIARATPKLKELKDLITNQVQVLMRQPAMIRLQRFDDEPPTQRAATSQAATAPTAAAAAAGAAVPPSDAALACCGCGEAGTRRSLKRCAGCRAAWYCSSACQARAWPQHKQACKAHAHSAQ